MTTETSAQGIVRRMAEAERECPCNDWHYATMHSCVPGRHSMLCQCLGTGRVPLLRELRQACPCSTPEYRCLGRTRESCCGRCDCGGTGSIPLPVPDAVAVLLRHPRFNSLYRDNREGVSGYVAEFTHPDSNSLVSKDIDAFDPEPELAVLLAAEKALLPQEGGKV